MRAGYRGESSAGGDNVDSPEGCRCDGRRGDGCLHALLFWHGVLRFVSEVAPARAIVTGNESTQHDCRPPVGVVCFVGLV